MAKRYATELVRLSLYGNMRPAKFPELAAKFSAKASVKTTEEKAKKPPRVSKRA